MSISRAIDAHCDRYCDPTCDNCLTVNACEGASANTCCWWKCGRDPEVCYEDALSSEADRMADLAHEDHLR